jgi:hypothetical protein
VRGDSRARKPAPVRAGRSTCGASLAPAGIAAARRTITPTDLSTAKRLFFLGLIASLVATAAIAIGVLLFSEFDETTARVLLTSAILALASLLALPAGVLLDQGRARALAWTTIALVALGFVVAMVLVWRDWEDEGGEGLWKTLAVVATVAAAASQASATTGRRRHTDPPAVRKLYVAAIALSLAVALMVVVAVVAEVDDETFYRVLGALVVADLLFVILQSVARRLPGRTPAGDATIRVTGPADAIEAAARELEARGLEVERAR